MDSMKEKEQMERGAQLRDMGTTTGGKTLYADYEGCRQE